MMVTGGADADVTSIYHYETNTFTTGAPMVIPRGYHAMAVIGDGSIFTAGGSWHGGLGGKHGEIWNPVTDSWSLLPGVQVEPLLSQDTGGVYRSDNHFWLFQSPVENMLFHAGPSKQMAFIDTSGNGSIIPSVVRETEDRMSGNALVIDTGVVFIVGGSPNYDSGLGTKKAFLVDINDPQNVQSREVGSMEFARTLSSSVLLPGGKVVVTGGQTEALLFSDEFAVMHTEIFDPATETFTTLPDQMRIPRTYHSAAILMIDGRVMVAGGGLCGGCTATHNDFEILSPPYLFAADGSLAPRPVISGAPTTTTAGAVIQITMAGTDTYEFELIRTSAATHSVNNDQRRIPLVRTAKNGRISTVQIPNNRNVALVGSYYLFAIDVNGVPSVATGLAIELSDVPVTNAPVTQAPTDVPTLAPVVVAQPTDVPTMAPVLPAANLLTNGSFEDWSSPVAAGRVGLRAAVGWTSFNGNLIEVRGSGSQGVPAVTGVNFIELDLLGTGSLDGIFQDVPTTAGQPYELSFYMRSRTTRITNVSEQVVVEWAGAVVGTYRAPVARQWYQHRVIVTGTGGLNRLLIREVNNSDGAGPFLDDVSLVAV